MVEVGLVAVLSVAALALLMSSNYLEALVAAFLALTALVVQSLRARS